jgi:hypothetical protein
VNSGGIDGPPNVFSQACEYWSLAVHPASPLDCSILRAPQHGASDAG